MKTKNLGLHYGRFLAILEGYTDASLISSVEYHKSAFMWIFTLAEGTISWKSKKQIWITGLRLLLLLVKKSSG